MGEATSAVINNQKILFCASAAWPIHNFDLTNKDSNILFLKVRKLDEEVIDIGREFQILFALCCLQLLQLFGWDLQFVAKL